MGKTRPVLVQAARGIVDGAFHGFYQFSEGGEAAALAVVEFEDGEVVMIAPDRIRFADAARPSGEGDGGGDHDGE